MFIHKHVVDSLKARFALAEIECSVTPKTSRFGNRAEIRLSRGGLSKVFNVDVFENPFSSLIGPVANVVVSTAGDNSVRKRFGFQYSGAVMREGRLDMSRVYADRLRCAGEMSEYMIMEMKENSP